jgi:hypothetical protein
VGAVDDARVWPAEVGIHLPLRFTGVNSINQAQSAVTFRARYRQKRSARNIAYSGTLDGGARVMLRYAHE